MRTLFSMIFILAATVAMGQNVPQITVSQEKVKVNGNVMFVHKVKGGETLYSLAKVYNVTIDDIVRHNESLKAGLKEGSTIYIPSREPATEPAVEPVVESTHATVKATAAPQGWTLSKENIKKYSRKKHKVKWFEKLSDIAAKYKVEEEAIVAMNSLESTVVKKKQVLYIPNGDFIALLKDNTTTSQQVTDETPGQVVKVEIAENDEDADIIPNPGKNAELTYILPLRLKDTIKPDSNFMDFYSGALLAADTLKGLGYNLTLNIIDQHMYGSINGIIEGGLIDGKKLIIGPVKAQDLENMLSSVDKGSTVISPMDMNSAYLAAENENFIQAPPVPEVQLENLIDLFASKCNLSNSALIIYEKDGADTALVNDVLRLLDARSVIYNKFSYGVLEGREVLDKIMYALEPGLDNLVLVPSNSEAFVSDVVRNLNLLHTNPATEKKRSITLFGTSRWRSFETIEVDYFHRLNLHLCLPYFVDYNAPLVKKFLMKYRALFNSEPSPYAFQGFDVTMMSVGMPHITTQIRYNLVKDNKNTGIRNTGTVNIVYDNNYGVSVIK